MVLNADQLFDVKHLSNLLTVKKKAYLGKLTVKYVVFKSECRTKQTFLFVGNRCFRLSSSPDGLFYQSCP